jgi:hypothetical protein
LLREVFGVACGSVDFAEAIRQRLREKEDADRASGGRARALVFQERNLTRINSMAAHPIRSVAVPKHPTQHFVEVDVRLGMRKEVAMQLADDQAIEQEVNRRLAEYERWVAREERANGKGWFNAGK